MEVIDSLYMQLPLKAVKQVVALVHKTHVCTGPLKMEWTILFTFLSYLVQCHFSSVLLKWNLVLSILMTYLCIC